MKSPLFENKILQQIWASSSDAILITNKNAEIVYVNPAWQKLSGYPYIEVIGKNPRFLKSGKTPKYVYKKMWKALAHGKTFSSEEVVNKKKNGHEYRIHCAIYPIFDNGKIIYYVQRQRDITSQKRLDELRKEFLSASAHELKTPITVLKLLTQSHLNRAKEHGVDTIKASELELIDRELDRLIRLINDMLDSSRFDTGKQFMTFEEVSIADLAKKTVEKIQIYAKNHTIILQTVSHDTHVIADPTRIEQVLLNLLSNAVKYSPDGSEIVLQVTKDDKNVIVSVTDHGIGIAKNMQNIIFDRYFQVKAKSKTGFGLGLYIAKEIIKRHKGKIWVESKRNQGSTFYFSLPLAAI